MVFELWGDEKDSGKFLEERLQKSMDIESTHWQVVLKIVWIVIGLMLWKQTHAGHLLKLDGKDLMERIENAGRRRADQKDRIV